MNKIYQSLRNPQVWGFFLSMAILMAISLAFFAPDNFEGNTLSQPDMQQGMANGQEGKAYQELTGEKALWTNSLFSGMPTFQISPSYPSNSLFTWLNSLYGMFLPQPSNLLFMMMFGFLIFMFCLGKRWYYGLIGAVAWGLSSYFVIIIGAGHIWKFITLSYIPPTLGGIVLCYRRRYVLGGALTALFSMLQFNANHPQMSYYFAFVIAAFVIVYLIDAVREKQPKQWGIASAIIIGALLLGVCANLPSLYNSYMYSKETQRAPSELTHTSLDENPAERPTGGMPKSQIVGWSYGGSEMFSLLVPNVKGGATARPERGTMEYMGLNRLDGALDANPNDRQLLQYFPQYFNDSEGTNGPVYVGALICALFLLGCFIVKGPMKWALLALTVLSMLLALGRNFEALTDFMIYNFPLYSKFRAVESILVVAEFTMPLLAVLGLIQFVENCASDTKDAAAKELRGRSMQGLLWSFGICVVLCLVAAAFPRWFGAPITTQDRALFAQIYDNYNYPTIGLQQTIESLRLGMVTDDALRSLLILLIGFGALFLYGRRHLSKYLAVSVVGLLVLFDLYGVDKRYVSTDSFVPYNPLAETNGIPAPKPDAIDQYILQDPDPHYRVMDIPGFSKADRSYFHKTIGGYHAAKLRRYNDLITTGKISDRNVLDMLNARYIITGDQEQPVVYNPYALGNAWLIDEIRYVKDADAELAALDAIDPAHQAVADEEFFSVLGKDVVAPVPGDTIYLTSYTPNTLKYEVDTRAGGVGVFSEVYFPWGWKATVDGQETPLARVNYLLRAIKLPAGKHEVVMTFDPQSIHTTSAVAYASVTLIYLWLLVAVFFEVTGMREGRRGKLKDLS